MRNQAAIESYYSYFENQLRSIFALYDPMYRKTLSVIVLDTLGRARLPGVRGNHAKFVQFVRACGDWSDAGRVSLPQVAWNLSRNPKTADKPLAREVNRRLRNWKIGNVYPINSDPELSELEKLVTVPMEKKLLEGHQHIELLYTYRNTLVHEFREPGYDMGPIGDEPTPYYCNMQDERGVDHWELAYPVKFFVFIAEHCLGNLRLYLEENDLDPYSFYEFGSIWKSAVLKV